MIGTVSLVVQCTVVEYASEQVNSVDSCHAAVAALIAGRWERDTPIPIK